MSPRVLADINLETLSLFIHVSAAVVGLGATFGLAVALPVALKLGEPRNFPFVHHLSHRITQRLASPALLVLLITGIFQVAHSDLYKMSDAWVSATFVILIVIGGLQGAYFMRTDRRLAAMAEQELAKGATKLSDDYLRQANREGAIGALAGLLIIIAIFLMVTKPG
jgi:uncharacterized membrane protein